MRIPAIFFALSVLIIGAAWSWLGAPVAMPPSPLAGNEKLYCVSYAPFRGTQSPLVATTHIEPWQIEEDFARLARLTDCVRTYSTEHGLDKAPEIAKRHGLKVMQGLWLAGQPARDRIRIDEAVALARQHPDVIRSLVIGNEVLLRGEMTGEALAATIRAVKAQVPMPVTYADVWEFWLRHPQVQAAVDFVTIHILPYWEDFPIPAREAAAHVDAIRSQVATRFPDKDILIGETGWPSAGRMREGALPSPSNQARVIHEVLAAAKRGNYRVNVIEAFDQPWKRALEGTVGGHWGFLDADSREFKFAWGQALSNHPGWRWQAAGGIALAALVFGAALAARDGRLPSARLWFGVAAGATVAGLLTPWGFQNLPVESLGVGGWLRALAVVALSVAVPIVGAAALVRQTPVPAFADVLARRGQRARDRLAFAAGGLLIGLSVLGVMIALGLVFDPRYRDFPFAPMTAATLPFVILAFALPRPPGARGVAESLMAATLALAVIYVVPNETFANWQSLWTCGIFAALAIVLWRARAPAAPG